MVKQKTVHDGNKRKDADVTDHNQMNLGPNKQWEKNIKTEFDGKDQPPCHSWLPRAAKDRPQPHKKINECDH